MQSWGRPRPPGTPSSSNMAIAGIAALRLGNLFIVAALVLHTTHAYAGLVRRHGRILSSSVASGRCISCPCMFRVSTWQIQAPRHLPLSSLDRVRIDGAQRHRSSIRLYQLCLVLFALAFAALFSSVGTQLVFHEMFFSHVCTNAQLLKICGQVSAQLEAEVAALDDKDGLISHAT